MKLKTLWQVFASFFRIGAFTFGGGYAMIPLIQNEAVEKRKWVTDDDILEVIAIAESTPGPIAINSATFVGYRAAGILGSVCATLGVVLPSFVIILAISFVLKEFQDLKPVQYAFMGIRAGVLVEGDKLPSVRELASELAINPNTIQRAYRELEVDGWIASVSGKGSFVCGAPRQENPETDALWQELDTVAAKLMATGISRQAILQYLKQGGDTNA